MLNSVHRATVLHWGVSGHAPVEDVAVKLASWVAAVTVMSCQQCHGPLFYAECSQPHSSLSRRYSIYQYMYIFTSYQQHFCILQNVLSCLDSHNTMAIEQECPLQCKQASVAAETARERAAPADVAVAPAALAAANAAAAGAVVLASVVA